MAYLTPHANVLNTTSIAIASADTAQAITFDTNGILKKIAHSTSVNTSRLTVNETGDYIVNLSIQVASTGANKTASIWLAINGTNVANTNSSIVLVNANDRKRLTISTAVTLTAGQYVEIIVSADSTNISFPAIAAQVTPTRPATPSVVLTIDKLP